MSIILQKKAKELIQNAEHILLLTDERIDGDTIGSTLGMYHVLDQMGKRVEVFSPEPILKSLEFLPGVEVIQRDRLIFDQRSIDLVMVFDCADGAYFKEDIKKLRSGTQVIVFDHHKTNPGYGTVNFIDPNAAAASGVLWKFLREMDFSINKKAAQCILTGICTDTNNFSTSNTNAVCLEAAHELSKYGAKIQEIVRETMMNKSVNTLKLWGLAFERLHHNSKFDMIATAITLEDIKRLQIEEIETQSLSNFLNAMVEGADAILVMREVEDSSVPSGVSVKCSFRSQTRDVARIAESYGGGGHKKASGFKIKNAKLILKDGVWRVMKN